MIPVFIASNTSYSGRTFISLGLAMKLAEQGLRVGYIKPVGRSPIKQDHAVYDADALFIREALELDEAAEVISPFVTTYESEVLLFEGGIGDIGKTVRNAFGALRDRDVVIVGCPSDLHEGALLGVSTLELLKETNGRLLLVEPWRGSASADTLYGIRTMLGDSFIGGVINKIPMNAVNHVKGTVRPYLEQMGVPIFGVVPKDRSLEAVSVRQLADILNGKVLCCSNHLDEFVENYAIGAMDVDSALAHFRRLTNKAVITGAHRSDIQLAAMETSTRCIILTGGLTSNDVVIGKAEAKGIPIISVADDTFTTIERIETALGKTSIRDPRKVARVKELMDIEFDTKRFMAVLKAIL